MAEKRPICLYSGQLQELASGDSLPPPNSIVLEDGTAATPSLRFASNTDSGIYYATGTINIGYDATSRLALNASAITASIPFLALGSSTIGSPAISFSGYTGMGFRAYFDTENAMSIGVTSTEVITVKAGGITITGSAAVTGGVDKLTTATGVVSVAAATAPSVGQVLTATGATTATWQSAVGLFAEDAYGNIVGGTSAAAAMLTNGSAFDNMIMGELAGVAVVSPVDSVILGNEAVHYPAGSPSSLTAIGSYAFGGHVTQGVTAIGNDTTGVGSNVGKSSKGAQNSLFGSYAFGGGNSQFPGDDNCIFGYRTMDSVTDTTNGAFRNTVYGSQAGTQISGNCDDNTIIGFKAMESGSNSNNNVVLGQNAGARLFSGASNNVIIGPSAGPLTSNNPSNEFWLNNTQSETPLMHGYFNAHTSGPYVKINGAFEVTGDVTVGGALVGGVANDSVIINGDFDICQRRTTYTTVTDDEGVVVADRFRFFQTSTMRGIISQSTSVPTYAQSGHYSNSSLWVDVTTGDTTIAAGDAAFIQYRVEGYDYRRIAGGDATLSFWVQASSTGTYCVSVRNAGPDRSYVKEYTITTADTWEKISLTFPLTETGGTWNYINGVGLMIYWPLVTGTTYQTTANAWQTGNYMATSNQINGVATNTENFRLAQVKLEKGTTATPFKTRTIKEELALCQRYYEKSYAMTVVPGTVNSEGDARFYISALASGVHDGGKNENFAVRKRATPTMVAYSPSTGTSGKVRSHQNAADVNVTTASIGESGFMWYAPVTEAGTAVNHAVHWTAEAELF